MRVRMALTIETLSVGGPGPQPLTCSGAQPLPIVQVRSLRGKPNSSFSEAHSPCSSWFSNSSGGPFKHKAGCLWVLGKRMYLEPIPRGCGCRFQVSTVGSTALDCCGMRGRWVRVSGGRHPLLQPLASTLHPQKAPPPLLYVLLVPSLHLPCLLPPGLALLGAHSERACCTPLQGPTYSFSSVSS